MEYRHSSYPPPPRTAGEWVVSLLVGMIVATGCLLSMLLVMVITGSLAAHWHGKHAVPLMLLVGGVMSFLPAVVLNGFFTWLRQQWNKYASFSDTFFPILLIGNTLLVIGLVLFLPGRTSQALHQYGSWMFDKKIATFLDVNEQHVVFRTGRKLVRRMAYLLEVESQRARIARTQKARATQSSKRGAPPINNLIPPQYTDAGIATRPPPHNTTPAQIRPLSPPTRAAPTKVGYLRFRKHGSVPEVKVTLGNQPTRYLWDTGASFLTLTKKMAYKLGAMPGYRAPSLIVHTANGRVRTRVGLLRQVSLGGFTLHNVAFVLCDACADTSQNVQGLLGSNVQRRFRFSVDHSEGHIELRPQPADRWVNQALDIRPFLKPKQLKGSTINLYVRRVFRLSALLENKAPVEVKHLKYQISYMRSSKIVGTKAFRVLPLRPGERRQISYMDKKAPSFDKYRIELIEGQWRKP